VKSRNGLVNQRKALGFRRCLPIQREFIILKANLMALPCTRCDFWLALSCSSMILFRVLRAPVFGTLDARIEVADYRAREALLRYKANVLGAVQEVDQAIAGYNAEQNRLIRLSRARSAALDAVRLSSERYERGLTDFLNVLDAERQLFEIEVQDVISRRMAGVQLVALYKALGGGWEHYQAVPPIRFPEPAIAAAARESNGLRPISMDPGLSQVQP
jgi:hypothetical protein